MSSPCIGWTVSQYKVSPSILPSLHGVIDDEHTLRSFSTCDRGLLLVLITVENEDSQRSVVGKRNYVGMDSAVRFRKLKVLSQLLSASPVRPLTAAGAKEPTPTVCGETLSVGGCDSVLYPSSPESSWRR